MQQDSMGGPAAAASLPPYLLAFAKRALELRHEGCLGEISRDRV
jgi:hypothetical protein